MKKIAATALSMSLAAAAPAFSEETRPGTGAVKRADIQAVSPGLDKYINGMLLGEVWKRSGLSPRDRSVVTVAALIAKNQSVEMPYYFNLALDNGVKPAELSEIIIHLAFYSGFPNAVSAVSVAKDVFAQRGVGLDQLPPESPELLQLDASSETARAERVQQSVGSVSQGVVDYTDKLFKDVWQRPGLAPRDRSLVTVASLIANGQTAQITVHLNKAMDNGLTREQASETLTQLSFYVGWPNIFSAVPVVKDVFDKRAS